MALYKVITYPDPVLLRKAEPVSSISSRERILVQDMIDTMHAEHGVGLAANQIGISKRVFVVSIDGVRGKELAYFNPEIISRKGRLREHEGCLSIPGIHEPVKRYEKVTLRAMDLDGKTVEVEAQGLLSRIIQHEVDHLNGALFVHRLGWWKRRRVFKNLKSDFQ